LPGAAGQRVLAAASLIVSPLEGAVTPEASTTSSPGRSSAPGTLEAARRCIDRREKSFLKVKLWRRWCRAILDNEEIDALKPLELVGAIGSRSSSTVSKGLSLSPITLSAAVSDPW